MALDMATCLPRKVQLMVWLIMHHSLPTNDVRFRRGMTSNPLCSVCGMEEDSWQHSLFLCPWAVEVWSRCGVKTEVLLSGIEVSSMPAIAGLFKAASAKDLATLWLIWIEHNAKCFRGESTPIWRTIRNIELLAHDYSKLFRLLQQPKETRFVSWNPESHNNYIVHVDGSSLGNPGNAGFGVVVRNADGGWVQGSTGHIGVADNLAAELFRILHGLRKIQQLNFDNAILYSDSQEAIWLLFKEANRNHIYAALILNIRDCWDRERTRICHILREGNSVADALARRGAREANFFTTWAFPPDDIDPLLSANALGVMYPRP